MMFRSFMPTLTLGMGFFCLFLPVVVLSAPSFQSIVLQTPDFDTTLEHLISLGVDVAGTDWEQGIIEMILTPSQWEALREDPYVQSATLLPAFRSSDNLNAYTDPDEMFTLMKTLAETHPNIAKMVDLGELTYNRRRIWAMKISDHVEEDEDEPVFLLDALHHAREVMTAEIARDAMEYLITHYEDDLAVKNWVNSLEIWIVPIVNPDGHAYVFHGDWLWRKNRHGACPVDINRNYSATFDACEGSSSQCDAQDYRGLYGTSEKETQAMENLMEAIHPDIYLSYHSYGQYIIWPYGCQQTPQEATYQRLAKEINNRLESDTGIVGRYRLGTSYETLYKTDGTSDDHAYATYGTLSFTIEVNSYNIGGFQPDYETWRDITVIRQRAAWQYLLSYLSDGLTLRLKIRDALTGEPIPSASYTVDALSSTGWEKTWTANTHGTIFFIPEPMSTYTFHIAAPGYLPAEVTIPVGDRSQNREVSLFRTMEPAGNLSFDTIDF